MADLLNDVQANNTKKTTGAQWTTILKALEEWGVSPWPMSKDKVIRLAASLKRGGFRSARNYLSLYRVRAARRGQQVTGQLLRTFRDVGRSCARGMGAPRRSTPLPLERLGELPEGDEPWSKGGPVGPTCPTVAGSMFLMREIELSCSRASSVTLETLPDRWQVKWLLPASKNGPRGSGGYAAPRVLPSRRSPSTRLRRPPTVRESLQRNRRRPAAGQLDLTHEKHAACNRGAVGAHWTPF